MNYPAVFQPTHKNKTLVTFPDVDEVVTQGNDEQDAAAMAQDALITWFAHCIRHGKPIPPPSQPKGRKYRMIGLPAIIAIKVQLYVAFQASGMSKAEFGRHLGIPKTNVDRLFNFKNHTRLDQMEQAFRVLGRQLVVSIGTAA